MFVLPAFRELTFNQTVHIMIHQASHLIHHPTIDEGYGARICIDFARFEPWDAALNADNYAWFALNRNGLP